MARTLVTIGISHYCEKARWALDRAGLPFEERAYAPGTHLFATLPRGGRTTPILVDGDVVVRDSTDILDHVQRHPDAAFRPWPGGPHDAEVRALEARFDEEVGIHLRRWLYHQLLPHREATVAVFASRTPPGQRWWWSGCYPVMRQVIQRGLRIDDERSARSEERFQAVFAEVDARLADGRRYLVGDTFTAADLTFAALAAPALLPPEYLPVDLAALPDPVRAFVTAARERPLGRFVARMYTAERRRGSAGG